MYLKRVFLLAGLLLGSCFLTGHAADVFTQNPQQVKQAQATLRAIARQLGRYYTLYHRYPQAAFSDENFAALGMKEPPSKIWEYFFECHANTCNIVAEHRRQYYMPENLSGITPLLRLSLHQTNAEPFIRIEARSIWFMQKKDTTVMMEQTYAAPLEICRWFGGRKDKKQGCILE